MFCGKCGTLNSDGDNYCMKCGSALGGPARVTASPAPSPGNETALPGAQPEPVYAGFWRRVGGYLIDYVVTLLFAAVFGVVGALAGGSDDEGAVWPLVLGLIAGWLYTTGLESGSHQATWGKRAVGIKVTTLSGERISFARANGRFFAHFITALTLGIGYVAAAFTKRRQTVHDMLAGTLVVHRDAQPGRVLASESAPPIRGWAIALIVVGAMVPLAGILAAIAIPAYQDYTIRAQISDGLNEAGQFKVAVAEAMLNTSEWQEVSSETLGLSSTVSSPYVAGIEVVSGAIAIRYGGSAHPKIRGKDLILTPYLDDTNNVGWICGTAAAPVGVRPAIEGYSRYTSILPAYLPSRCK